MSIVGIVKCYNVKNVWGFITSDKVDRDVFFHWSVLLIEYWNQESSMEQVLRCFCFTKWRFYNLIINPTFIRNRYFEGLSKSMDLKSKRKSNIERARLL